MSELKDICTSQETSRKLAEAGLRDSFFCWLRKWNEKDEEWVLGDKYDKEWREQILGNVYYLPAFTFNELWDILPQEIRIKEKRGHNYPQVYSYEKRIKYYNSEKVWIIGYYDDICDCKGCDETGLGESIDSEILQEAAAELVLWAIDEGYINPKEVE